MDLSFSYVRLYVNEQVYNIYYDRRYYEIDRLKRHVQGIQGSDLEAGCSKA